MITFNIDDFWNTLSDEHKLGGYETIKELGASNNHNDLMYEYRNTNYFIELANDTPDVIPEEGYMKTFDDIGAWLLDFERSNPNVTYDVVKTVSLKWAEHLLASGSFGVFDRYRFTPNHLNKKQDTYDVLTYTIDLYNNIVSDEYPSGIDYHTICSGLWTLCDAGQTDMVITIGEMFKTLGEDIESEFTKKYTKPPMRSIDMLERFIMSLSWPIAQAYKHQGDFDNAKRIYRDIMNLMFIEKTRSGIHYYCGNNRGLEAGLELYKLEPTEEVRSWCFNQWKRLTELDIENTTESLNERLMISYMFLKVIYNVDL
jgi:hypothetical protein